eukprot:CAMPEP_0114530062 /NCGR_PEP_ID=MMETSP0109-20121206/25209_1 /TAXON_ID=29199 /ORGANISM="Chlorarachnion reptans, Strain CCCM449" /LENGTH=155 /DNA_ID=CAMNT_0001712589 /DNA_START=421 /DNA_END=885 /DNA_ORIENTATION=-
MFLSRSDTNVEDSLNDHVKRELKCHNEISGTGQIETKDSNARISNVSGERSRSHTHAAALLSSAGLSSMKGCKASKSIPYIIPTTRRKLSRYNVEEFSQHNELDEEVEESSPIEANVCRRCGAVTEKKMLCQMMTNNRLSLVLLPEDQKKITQPK